MKRCVSDPDWAVGMLSDVWCHRDKMRPRVPYERGAGAFCCWPQAGHRAPWGRMFFFRNGVW